MIFRIVHLVKAVKAWALSALGNVLSKIYDCTNVQHFHMTTAWQGEAFS